MGTLNRLLQCSLFVSTVFICFGEFLEDDFIIEFDTNFTNTNASQVNARTLVDCAGICVRSSACRYAAFNNQVQTCIVANDFSHDAGTYALGWIFIKTSVSASISCTDCVGYGSSLYKFVDTPLMMSDAKVICENLGGKLVEVETEPENNFLKGHMSALYSQCNFWMGAYSFTPDSSFVWLSKSNEPLPFTEFGPGEPSHPVTQFCLGFYQPYGYLWADLPCSWTWCYVCEFSA